MSTIARPNCSASRLVAAVAGLILVICPFTLETSAADECAGDQSPQTPAETDSLQWWQDQLQRTRQVAEKEAAAADENGGIGQPLRKSRSPSSGTDSGSLRPAGPSVDVIMNEAGGYEVAAEGESPQEFNSSANQAKSTTAETEHPPFPSSDEINEMDRQARRYTLSGFLSFLVIAAIVFIVAYVLPAVLWGRKSAASKVRIEKPGDWQETASPTPKEPDNP